MEATPSRAQLRKFSDATSSLDHATWMDDKYRFRRHMAACEASYMFHVPQPGEAEPATQAGWSTPGDVSNWTEAIMPAMQVRFDVTFTQRLLARAQATHAGVLPARARRRH
jgi:hypothetical protein